MRHGFEYKLLAAIYALMCAAPAFADLTAVDHADDVCAPNADPCAITERVATVSGASLDFGFRHIEVTGKGGFDIGTGSLTIKCGGFSAATGNGVRLVNGRGHGQDAGGEIDIIARGFCIDAPAQPCFEDLDCTTGACAGIAAVTIAGDIELHGRAGGGLTVDAKDDVVVSDVIDVSGGLDGAGGVFIRSHRGSLTLDAPIVARSPGYGAFVYLTTDPVIQDSRSVEARGAVSSRGMTINAPILASAGEQGGEIYLVSIADLKLNASIYASGHGTYEYGGYGGYITVIAEGGDLALAPNVRLYADATMNAKDAGDGGLIEVRADGGSLVVPSGVKVRARGGGAYAYGGQVYFSALGDAAVNARVDVSSHGVESSGGDVAFEADRSLMVGPEFRMRARGVDQGGLVSLFAAQASIEGRFSLPVGGPGYSGNFFAAADDLTLGARIDVSGAAAVQYDALEIEACNVTLLGTADIRNRVRSGVNEIEARATLTVDAGASVATVGEGGINRFIYRVPAQAPVILGTVTPAPVLELNEALVPCP